MAEIFDWLTGNHNNDESAREKLACESLVIPTLHKTGSLDLNDQTAYSSDSTEVRNHDKESKAVIEICGFNNDIQPDLEPGENNLSLKHSIRGSGVIVTKDGLALTAAHVVANRKTLLVKTEDGNWRFARVLDMNPGKDSAVIQIDKDSDDEQFDYAQLANPYQMQIGERVDMIGYPDPDNKFSHKMFLSVGKYKGTTDTPVLTYDKGMTRCSYPNAPGFSGSPVFNTRGEVIGINSNHGCDTPDFSDWKLNSSPESRCVSLEELQTELIRAMQLRRKLEASNRYPAIDDSSD